MGTTFGRYLRSQRLNLARHEICCGKGAEEAAYTAGFNDYSTFFRAYKALFREAPAASLSPAAETGISSGNP
jgi:AraC-like DNA-binding protein